MLNPVQKIPSQTAHDAERQMHVLVLDDNEVDRQKLIRLCHEAGLNAICTEAATIDDMRSALGAQSFDLVFIDYLLVGEDGIEALDLLMQDPTQSATSIMIAGEGRIDIAVEAMRRGCSDYLTKSTLSVEVLQKSVATALERRMMSLSLEEERGKRQSLELAVRRYANECSIEMRTILAGTLRRVRKLRAHAKSAEHTAALGDLEVSIDRLWDALPQFAEQTESRLEPAAAPKLIEKS